jgi:hypothetical protein
VLLIIGSVLAGFIAAGIITIGASYFWVLEWTAASFGIPGTQLVDPAQRAWVRVKGVRDIVSGLFVVILLAAGSTHLLGWIMLAGALIPVGDASIVRSSHGPAVAAYGIHAVTAAVMLVIGLLLLLG